jgi:PKD domain
MRSSMFMCCAAIVALALACSAAPATATVLTPSVLDGPSASILEVDGAAMAPDGTGGVVYRKLVDGVPHVFVSRFLKGTWEKPLQADVGQLGPATDPTIAAGEGGELLVVWVQPWTWISSSPGAAATLHYELMSAVLQPGASSFGQIERIEEVGNGTAAYPSLAMAPNGDAYVAYRIVTNPLTPGTAVPIQPMRTGDELAEVRVARFNGLTWSSLGDMNGLPGEVTMRKPSASNAPVVGVDNDGDGLVVWQEPDIEGVARIWARRLSGTTKGNPMQVSPSTIGGLPVDVDADAPALAFNEYGQAVVGFRLEGGQGSPLGASALLANALTLPVPEELSSFAGAEPLAKAEGISEPSVAIDEDGADRIAYTAGGDADLVSEKEKVVTGPSILGSGSGPALTALNPEGGGATAWSTSDPAGEPAVELRQEFPDGAWQAGYLTAPVSGSISDLFAAGSGLGDELIVFREGSSTSTRIVASVAQAPPKRFYVDVPSGWVKAADAKVEWQKAVESVGSVTYSVLVDGKVVVDGLHSLSTRLSARELGNGVREVQVLATDDLGQQTMSAPAKLKAQTSPPLVSVHRIGRRRVKVRVYGDNAGVKVAKTRVSFGDGSTVRGHDAVVHAYAHAGRYTVTVEATDKIGNRRQAHVLVSIR